MSKLRLVPTADDTAEILSGLSKEECQEAEMEGQEEPSSEGEHPEEDGEAAEYEEVYEVEKAVKAITEDSAALQFVEAHKDDLRFCHSTGAWYRWDGSRWKLDQTQLAFQWARVLLRALAKKQKKSARTLSKVSLAASVERYA